MVRELSSVAETLQTVQRARKRFLHLWSVENQYINPMLDRMADDLARVAPDGRDDVDIDVADDDQPQQPRRPQQERSPSD